MCSILILHPYLIHPAFQFLWYWLPARNPPHTPTCLLFHYLAFLKLGVKESKRGRRPTLEWMNECEPTGSSYTACLQCCFEVAIAAVPAEAGSWRDDKEIKSRASMNILFWERWERVRSSLDKKEKIVKLRCFSWLQLLSVSFSLLICLSPFPQPDGLASLSNCFLKSIDP